MAETVSIRFCESTKPLFERKILFADIFIRKGKIRLTGCEAVIFKPIILLGRLILARQRVMNTLALGDKLIIILILWSHST